MAQRDLSNFREVVSQVAEKPNDLLAATAEIGQQIIKQGQEAKINENLSRASLELNQLHNQYQIDYERDPMAGMDAFRQQRQAIFDKYGKEVSPIFRRAWNDQARTVGLRSDASQQAWALKQTRQNTVRSINESMKNNFLQANIDGQNFGNSDESEIGAYINFQGSKNQLAGWAANNLGEETSAEMLGDYDKDYMKSFISGVADSNPKKAAKLLQDDTVKEMFSSDEIGTFENIIKRNEKKQKIGALYNEMDAEDQVAEIVNTDGDYYSKRLEIDTMELEGKISSTVATRARRVLTSQKNVDSVSDPDASADILTEMYDLNAIGETSQEDYLIGVKNIREKILEDQASGKISPTDAAKLNKQLRTLTAKKTADATQEVGIEFYDAKKKFELLPPEYRGKATRELFYKTQGQENLSKEAYGSYATEIVDKYKKEIRSNTIKKIDEINAADSDFIKSKGYTMDDVKETALKYGMSEQEVIRKLKAK